MEEEKSLNIKRILFLVVVCALLVVIGYSGSQLLEIHQNNAQEAELHSRLMQYRPEILPPLPVAPAPELGSEVLPESFLDIPSAPSVNQSIVDLQATYSEAVGWLTIPNTKIDYPFAQGESNDIYLHMDLDQRWSAAGTIFMDFRNSRDFSDFNTILFGHHMRNGSMFGTLQQFNSQTFFDANRSGTIFLADKTYEITFIAFAVIVPDDAVVYNPVIETDADAVAFLDHVRSVARYYRDVGVTADDRLVTLSTCNYEFDDARMVLIGRLTEIVF